MEYERAFQKLGSKERKDIFTIDDIFRLKGNSFCFMFIFNIKKMLLWKVSLIREHMIEEKLFKF